MPESDNAHDRLAYWIERQIFEPAGSIESAQIVIERVDRHSIDLIR